MTGAPNCNNPSWTDPVECEVVDEAYSPLQAYADYVTMFYPRLTRTYEAVRRRWNRTHGKIRLVANCEGCGAELIAPYDGQPYWCTECSHNEDMGKIVEAV
jgi:hypothetical protein